MARQPTTEQGRLRVANRAGRNALATIANHLWQLHRIRLIADTPASYIQYSTTLPGGTRISLTAKPEGERDGYNGKVRIVLLKNDAAQRQFPQTAAGVNVDRIVETVAAFVNQAVEAEAIEATSTQAVIALRESVVQLQKLTDRINADLIVNESRQAFDLVIPCRDEVDVANVVHAIEAQEVRR